MSRRPGKSTSDRAIDETILRRHAEDLSFCPGAGIVVGFSGGVDSLALALLLKRTMPAHRRRVRLLHVDHRLRPDSSQAALAAASLAERLGLPFDLRAVHHHAIASHQGAGIEEAARRERFRVFASAVHDDEVLALAHQQDDQAETVLMHLLRGAGSDGASGMPYLSALTVPWWPEGDGEGRTLPVWRPLLDLRRAELRALAQRAGLEPVEDPTNDDLAITRNAVRRELLPAIERRFPGGIPSLSRFAAIAQEEDRYLTDVTARALAEAARGDDLDRAKLTDLPLAVARRVARTWLLGRGVPEPSLDRVEALLGLALSGDQAARVELGGGILAGVFGPLVRVADDNTLARLAADDAGLALPLLDEARWGVVVRDDMADPATSAAYRGGRSVAARSAPPECRHAELRVRPVCRQERIGASGMRVDAWLREHRVSPWIRDRVQGIALDGDLWWIPLISDDYGVTGDRVIRVWWE